MIKVISQAEGVDVYRLFRESGAILEGHFELTSGYHSGIYMQCAALLQYPDRAGILAQAAAGMLDDMFGADNIETVVSPAVGGILWGYLLAEKLGCRMIFAERKDGKMGLHRGFELKKGEKAVIAEDVITTGGSVREVISICRDSGAGILAVAGIVDRNSGVDFGYPYINMIKFDIEKYPPHDCGLCKDGVPVIYPGSRKK
jgi:orotate phosphoribosyltransferase